MEPEQAGPARVPERRDWVPPLRHFRATSATTTMADVEVAPEDLRVDTIVVADGRPSAIRVTHLPTGTAVRVSDQPTFEDNRDRAMELLLELLTPI